LALNRFSDTDAYHAGHGRAGQLTAQDFCALQSRPYLGRVDVSLESTIAGGDGSRQPSAVERDAARYQGKYVAEIAGKLAL